MPEESKSGMQCSAFDALLSGALDGELTGATLEGFHAHSHRCSVCGPLLEEAQAGQRWLKSLEEVDPPADLIRSIVLATSGVRPSWWERFTSSYIVPLVAVARQPRFAMSFGMAFFSLSVALNVAGVKLSDVSNVDLRPSAIKRTYYETTGKVQRYYQNMRLVYEVESRVREIRRATTPAEPAPKRQEKERRDNNNTSGQPDQKQERNYSQGENQPALAAVPEDPPVVKVTTYRRFV